MFGWNAIDTDKRFEGRRPSQEDEVVTITARLANSASAGSFVWSHA